MALGVKQHRSLGVDAATMWVLKDALGKFSRIFWASKNGRRFDSDAKKWRFRSALLYSLGNALEIFTYLLPSLFLVTAAVANALKQMALLTSSATRNAIYKSFARNSDNIGDITAKGEAQLAIVDLVGMLVGVSVSRVINGSRMKLAVLFFFLSVADIHCTFNEIRSIVFTSLNFERAGIVLERLFGDAAPKVSPYEVTFGEQLLLSCLFNEGLFCGWSDLSKEVRASALERSITVFEKEPFVVSLEAAVVPRLLRPSRNAVTVRVPTARTAVTVTPRVILREDATPADVFSALLVVQRIVHSLRNLPCSYKPDVATRSRPTVADLGFSEDTLLGVSANALEYSKTEGPGIVAALVDKGWDMQRFMFGNITQRATWS
jgi:hypothetical protein